MLEILQIERSPLEGGVRVRVVNTSAGPVLSGIDLRAEPGMWLGPSQQKMELIYVPPGGERTVEVDYRLAQVSPEARIRIRVGVPEEHGDGWVHLPEPIAVWSSDLGDSQAARTFLDRFDRREAPHLAIFAVKGMFTPEQLEDLASSRERAIGELSRLLDVEPPPGIRLVFYPDATSKTADTDHVGAGFTKGTTVVEIHNDSVQLDPYHELAHVIAGQLGWAPAWLNEGFAVYASQYLGADALGQLGSPGRTVDEATCAFYRTGELLPLGDLFGLADIGPEGSRPHVTYAQSASFVGFLARRFGFGTLRDAYANLSPIASSEANDKAFAQAFGVTIQEAGEAWTERLNQTCH